MSVPGRDSSNPRVAISRPTSRSIHGLAPKPPARKTNYEAVKVLLPPKRELDPYGTCRVSLRCDVFDTFNNGLDGRFKELCYFFPEGGEITQDFQYVRRHNSPLQRELPFLYAATRVVFPQ